MHLRDQIIELLKECYDPEIPVDLWSLGLIYQIDIDEAPNEKSSIDITMSLTTPGCTMGQQMADDIKEKVSKLDQINMVEVAITFAPPWKPEMMTNQARKTLGFDTINQSNSNQKVSLLSKRIQRPR